MQINSSVKIKIVLVIGLLSVSAAAIFVRLCQQQVEVVGIGFSLFIASSRLIITSLILSPTYSQLKKIKAPTSAIYYAIGAGICLAFHFGLWISSLAFTSVAASVALVTTNPLWVALLSWLFLGKKLTPKIVIGIVIAITGSILIAVAGGSSNFGSQPLLGGIMALMGSWFVSGYILLGTSAQKQGLNTRQYIAIAYPVSALCLLPLPLLFQINYFGYPLPVYIYLLLMAIVSQIIGHTCFNWALTQLSPTTVSLTVLFEPVTSSLLAWWLFTEIPTISISIGVIILLLGVFLAESK